MGKIAAATISVGDILQSTEQVVVVTEVYIREDPNSPVCMVKYVVVDLISKQVSERTTDAKNFYDQEF